MKKIIFCCLFILIPTILFSMTIPEAEKYMEEAAKRWNADPNLIKAVAHIESRKGYEKYRFGWIGSPIRDKKGRIKNPGTYLAPMNIQWESRFLGKPPTSDPKVSIDVGARCFSGLWSKQAQLKRLETYNASCTKAYKNAVMQAKREFAAGIK